MRRRLYENRILLVACILSREFGTWSFAGDVAFTDQLSLADLVRYQAALSGKVVTPNTRASDLVTHVGFKELWARPEQFRGRRVTIDGRVQRIFHQGPIGSFPALAEIWISSPVGDLFCLIVPQGGAPGGSRENGDGVNGPSFGPRSPKLGQKVQGTGTFLKTIRYTAGDGPRLAPLIVGERPPVPAQDDVRVEDLGIFSPNRFVNQWAGSLVSCLVGAALGLFLVGVVVWRLFYSPFRRVAPQNRGRRGSGCRQPEASPIFIEPRD